jgi:predicted RNA-binding Zn-ribbon protein involved in translation (DUF1610 family)
LFESKTKKNRKPPQFVSYIEARIAPNVGSLETLTRLLELLSRLSPHEIPFELDPTKLSTRVMDSSSLLMAEYIFPKSVFREFSVKYLKGRFARNNQPLRFSISVADILSALKDAGSAITTFILRLTYIHEKKTIEKKVYRKRCCPKCGLEVMEENNKRDALKRGKRGNLYTCVRCGWKGAATGKLKKLTIFDDHIKSDSSSVTVVVDGDVKEEIPVTLHDRTPEIPRAPANDFSSSRAFPATQFSEKIRKIGKLNDYFAISSVCAKKGAHPRGRTLVIEGLSRDTGAYDKAVCARITISKDSPILLSEEGAKIERSIFSMHTFSRILPRDKDMVNVIQFHWSVDHLVRITWRLNALPDAAVRFFLRPEIPVKPEGL